MTLNFIHWRRPPSFSVLPTSFRTTVWKFHDFSITQFLREINFGDSRSPKSAILTHLKALNFDFCEFLHFLKAEIYQISKLYSSQNGKNGSFATSTFCKIDFT